MFRVFKAKWILPADNRVMEDGLLILENGKIVDVIDNSNPNRQNILNNASEIVDYGHSIITPGFINLHAHLQYTDLKKSDKEQPFIEWIKSLMLQYFFWSMKKKKASVVNGAKEMLLSGTTCVAQLSGETEFLEVFNQLDMKIYNFLETFSNNEAMTQAEFKKLKDKYRYLNQNKNDNVYIGLSPHSIYTVHSSLWRIISEFSSENDILIHTHLAESAAEMEWLKGNSSEINNLYKFTRWKNMIPCKTGLNPIQYLSEFNILNENLIAAHMIQLDKESMEKIFSQGVKFAHCPRSNLILHGKTIDVSDYQNYIDCIGLGTDSKYSNYDLNILHEAKYLKFSSHLDLFTQLNMLTINAAKILKIDNKVGSLKKDKDADFLVFKMDENKSYLDLFDINNPDDVYIKGKPVVKDQEIINWKFYDNKPANNRT